MSINPVQHTMVYDGKTYITEFATSCDCCSPCAFRKKCWKIRGIVNKCLASVNEDRRERYWKEVAK